MLPVVLLAVLAVLVLGACSSGSNDESDETPATTAPSTSSSATSTTTAGAPTTSASAATVKASETPAELANLWEKNFSPDDTFRVVDAPGGTVYVNDERRFAMGSCAATDTWKAPDDYFTTVCNP